MKRILQVFLRDLKSGLRDFIIVYVLVVPFILALVIKALIPGATSSTMQVVITQEEAGALSAYFSDFGQVAVVKDRDALIERVERLDDAFGVESVGGGYRIIREGNESETTYEMVRFLVQAYEQDFELPIQFEVEDIGEAMSPMALEGGILIMVFVTVFGGMIVLMNLIEEKSNKTLSAMNVSPVSKLEFVVGKGLVGFILPVLHVFGLMLQMGYDNIDYLKVLPLTLSIATISVTIGFAIGVVNDDVMNGVASMKTIFIPVLGSIFGAIFLAEQWHFTLYWSPFYWAYRGLKGIILDTAGWMDVLLYTGIILVLSGVVFLGLKKRIQRGLV